MKNEIKEIKNRAISYKIYDGELHKANFTAKEILTIIAEIEFLETENDKLHKDIGIYSNDMFQERKNYRELKRELQAVREALIKLEYSEQTIFGAEQVVIRMVDWKKLQTLAAKGK
jgi:predicted Zn-dependent protease